MANDQENDKLPQSLVSASGSPARHVPDFEIEQPQADPPPAPADLPEQLQAAVLTKTEHREDPRYLVGWRVAIVNKNSETSQTWYGRAYDVSLGGINIHSEYNLHFSDSVVLLLSMPSRVPGKRPRIVEIECKSLYTILMANSPDFRIGFCFADFKKDGKQSLEQYLATVPRVTASSWGV